MRSLLCVALCSTLVMPVLAALKAGDAAPDFTTQASLNGKAFSYSLQDALKKGPVVVYFYPSAYTGGCNAQAHAFAVNLEKFQAAGASVVGVSLDSIERLNDFSADPDYCAGKLPVASDGDGKIAKSYDLTIHQGKPVYELRFHSLFKPGRGLSFDCDSSGNVDLDALSVRARDNYLYARTVIGREFFIPVIRPRNLH